MFCPEHPKRDQNPKFTPLSETTSIPVCFIWESPPPGNVAPFRSVIFYILLLQYLWQRNEDVKSLPKKRVSTSSSLESIHLYHSPRCHLPRAKFFHARLHVPINKSSQRRCVQRFGRVYNPASEWKQAFSSLQHPRLYYNYCGHCFTSAKFTTVDAWLKTILFSLKTFYVVYLKLNRFTPNALMIHKECLSMQYILSCNHSKATKLTMWIGTKLEFSITENASNYDVTRPLI